MKYKISLFLSYIITIQDKNREILYNSYFDKSTDSVLLEKLFQIILFQYRKNDLPIRGIIGSGNSKKLIHQIIHFFIRQNLSRYNGCCFGQRKSQHTLYLFLHLTSFSIAVCTIFVTSVSGFSPSMPAGTPLMA